MLIRDRKLLFVHIPKCAGTSIEQAFGVAPFEWRKPNYKNLVGWCPVRSVHMQHLSIKELVELDFVTQDELDALTIFTVVRNPVYRMISDYFWMMRDRRVKGSFQQYFDKKAQFEEVLTNQRIPDYRGDHLRSQTSFIEGFERPKVNLMKFESLSSDWSKLSATIAGGLPDLPHTNKSSSTDNDRKQKLFTRRNISMIISRYETDFSNFGYSLDSEDYL